MSLYLGIAAGIWAMIANTMILPSRFRKRGNIVWVTDGFYEEWERFIRRHGNFIGFPPEAAKILEHRHAFLRNNSDANGVVDLRQKTVQTFIDEVDRWKSEVPRYKKR